MKFDPQKHHRHSIRLKGYDYSQPGGYFITIVTFQHQCLFAEIVDGEMKLNGCGRVADQCWHDIPEHFPNVDLGMHMIMPNHVHGTIIITDECRGEVLSPITIQRKIWTGRPRPYATQRWDKSLRISNINPRNR